jgi:hypothetical protein
MGFQNADAQSARRRPRSLAARQLDIDPCRCQQTHRDSRSIGAKDARVLTKMPERLC